MPVQAIRRSRPELLAIQAARRARMEAQRPRRVRHVQEPTR